MSAEDVVAWQWKLVDEADSQWCFCTTYQADRVRDDPEWQVRALVPLSTLTASQARYERLRGMVEGLALECHKLVIRIGNIDADGGSAGKQGLRDAESDLEELYEKLILLADGGEANDNEESK